MCLLGRRHVRVIVSLLYQVTRRLLSLPGVLLRREIAKGAELLVLRHEGEGPERGSPPSRRATLQVKSRAWGLGAQNVIASASLKQSSAAAVPVSVGRAEARRHRLAVPLTRHPPSSASIRTIPTPRPDTSPTSGSRCRSSVLVMDAHMKAVAVPGENQMRIAVRVDVSIGEQLGHGRTTASTVSGSAAVHGRDSRCLRVRWRPARTPPGTGNECAQPIALTATKLSRSYRPHPLVHWPPTQRPPPRASGRHRRCLFPSRAVLSDSRGAP